MDIVCILITASVFGLPLLYVMNHVVKFYIKLLMFYFYVNMSALCVFFLALMRPYNIDNYRFPKAFMSELQELYGIDIELEGSDLLDSPEPCVVVANHQTSLDMFGMMYAWPSRCVALAKHSLQYMWPFGPAAVLCGTVFVDRSNRKQAIRTMSNVAQIIKKEKVPVLPLVFSSYNFYSRRERRFDSGKLKIRCLPCIRTEGLTENNVTELTHLVRDRMVQAFQEINSP